jgi:hypothetical protein
LVAQLTVSLQAALPTLLRFPLTLLLGAFGALISVVIVLTAEGQKAPAFKRGMNGPSRLTTRLL